jgi:hypothetical protein
MGGTLIENRGAGWRRLAVAALLVLAGFLRLQRPSLMEFKADEAAALRRVEASLSGGGLPVRGLESSVGLPNPPAFIALLLIPGAVSRDPEFIAGFVALLNVAAVGLCYFFGRRVFNERTALVATLLFATAPWAVIYSRKIWAQDCMPFFSVLAIGGLTEVCARGNRRWFVPAALAAGLLPGLHFSGLWAPVIFGIALIAYRPRVGWRPVLLSVTLLTAFYLPYALTVWPPGPSRFTWAPGGVSLRPLRAALDHLSASGFEALLGASHARFLSTLPAALPEAGVVVHLGVAAAAIAGLILNLRRRREAGVVLLWALLPPLGFIPLSLIAPIHSHYLVMLYPVQFWLAGWTFDRAVNGGSRPGRLVARAWVAAAGTLNVLFLLSLFHFLGVEGGARGDYGVIYRTKLEAARFVAESRGSVAPAGLSSAPYAFLVERTRRERSTRGSDARAVPTPVFRVLEWTPPGSRAPGIRFGPVRVLRD